MSILHDIPVILASGYDDAQILTEAHSEQPNAVFHKPYQKAALKTAIKKSLWRAAAVSEERIRCIKIPKKIIYHNKLGK